MCRALFDPGHSGGSGPLLTGTTAVCFRRSIWYYGRTLVIGCDGSEANEIFKVVMAKTVTPSSRITSAAGKVLRSKSTSKAEKPDVGSAMSQIKKGKIKASDRTSSRHVATAAGKILQSKSASKAEKSVAASALTQIGSAKETTGSATAAAAAKILKNPRASREAKSVAASALTQKPKFRPKSAGSSEVYRVVKLYLAKREA